MTPTIPSRNPFANPGHVTLAELICRVTADERLLLRTRQNWCWALRTISRAAGKYPTEVPAHPEFLRKLLTRASPASIGIGRAAWNNARSLCGKALQWAGLTSVPVHYLAPYTTVWQELWNKLPTDTALAFQLARLFHYASAQGIPPAELNDAVLDEFYQALMTESIVSHPYEIYRSAAKSWNNAAECIPGWPPQRLSVPSRARVFCLPWSDFPPGLIADVESYLRRAAGLDLGDEHFTHVQRQATLETRRRQIRVLATAIVKSGVAAETLVGLRSMLTPPMAARGLQYLRDRNNGASGVQISNVADFLPTLASRLDMPGEVIGKLRRMKQKLKVTQHGMTARNREALRAFDDHASVEALLLLTQRILRNVRASGRKGYGEAKLVQTALAIELLINAPVRIENLASIRLGQHLLEVGIREAREVHVRFDAVEVKNHNDLEFPLVPEAVELLEIYLTEWRPLLCADPNPFLFPGKRSDQHKGKGALSIQVKELVHAYTRLDMPAHRFRHAVAKIFLDQNPGQYEIVRQLLGHKDIATTVGFYAGSESASAARHYHKSILAIRGDRANWKALRE